MSDMPLMPKATAVWLVENTSLTFEQIADFCGLHVLEVKGIADGDVAHGIRGLDPITSGQLSREEIERAQKDSAYRLKLSRSKVFIPEIKAKRAPKYTPVSRRHDRPNAILWLLRHHPEMRDTQIMRLVGTTKSTIEFDPRPHALELRQFAAAGPGCARALLADRPRLRGSEGRQARRGGAKGRARAGRRHHPAACGAALSRHRGMEIASQTVQKRQCGPDEAGRNWATHRTQPLRMLNAIHKRSKPVDRYASD